MSKADDLSGVPLGAQNPDNPEEICVQCPNCKKKRWVRKKVRGFGVFKAMGFISRCVSCASRQSQLRRSAALPDIPLLSGSIVRPSKKNPDNRNEELVICGICGKEHFDYRRPRHNAKDGFCVAQKGFCDDCWPLARVALRPEHDAGPSAERDAVYAKIKVIRRALEDSSRRTPKGALMPFCFLAKEWDEQNPQANSKTRDGQSYNVNLLFFHFGTMPIRDISHNMIKEFKRYLLDLPPTRGKGCFTKTRSEASVNQTLAVLRRMFSYAFERRWIGANPVDRSLTPTRREREPTPLVTVDEESLLLAACNGKLAYLREILISLSDTGMKEADRRRLRWDDVDFNDDTIKGSGSPIKMTPRLRAAMLALWECSDKNPGSFVWGSRNITGFKKDLGVARKAAQVEGLHINHFRPTAAWRLAQAGREFLQIAGMLGCTAEYLAQYLETDPEAAEREKASPSFKQFLSEQFGGSVSGNGDGQNNVAHRPSSDRDEWLLEIITKISVRWRPLPKATDDSTRKDNLTHIKQSYIAGDIEITVTALRARLEECGLKEMFPGVRNTYRELVDFVVTGLDRGDSEGKILTALKQKAVTVVAA